MTAKKVLGSYDILTLPHCDRPIQTNPVKPDKPVTFKQNVEKIFLITSKWRVRAFPHSKSNKRYYCCCGNSRQMH